MQPFWTSEPYERDVDSLREAAALPQSERVAMAEPETVARLDAAVHGTGAL